MRYLKHGGSKNSLGCGCLSVVCTVPSMHYAVVKGESIIWQLEPIMSLKMNYDR